MSNTDARQTGTIYLYFEMWYSGPSIIQLLSHDCNLLMSNHQPPITAPAKVSIVSISTHAVQAEVKFLGQIYATKFSFMMLMHAFSFSTMRRYMIELENVVLICTDCTYIIHIRFWSMNGIYESVLNRYIMSMIFKFVKRLTKMVWNPAQISPL